MCRGLQATGVKDSLVTGLADEAESSAAITTHVKSVDLAALAWLPRLTTSARGTTTA